MSTRKEIEYVKQIRCGNTFYEQGEYKEAYTAFLLAGKLFPYRMEALHLQVKALMKQCSSHKNEEQRQEIMRLCEKILIIDPDDSEFHKWYDEYSQYREKRAFAFYKSLFRRYPENMTVCHGFCKRFGSWEDRDYANHQISANQIFNILPKTAKHYVEMGYTVSCMNYVGTRHYHFDEVQFFEKALEFDPECVDALKCLGVYALDADMRVKYLERAFELSCDHMILIFLGNEYMKRAQYKKGLNCFKKFPFWWGGYKGPILSVHFEEACAEAYCLLMKMKSERRVSANVNTLLNSCRENVGHYNVERMLAQYGLSDTAA